ncbi:hypothetical protein Mgra_00008993 [Meloidogyne graminicola]|uniref:Uncharacterized protein n=1 Tax=Meloidogyne graminicola TaxID=189291 RepID=A0A8S9ZE83_9BILA|nr:hypothetical protein Mgra_00008993 [Meloidogyne graminicola]
MNELLAIILIVLLCCFLFFAWLFALATCPDRMVNLISGSKQSSSPISRASEDLLGLDEKAGSNNENVDNDNENNKNNSIKQNNVSNTYQNRRPHAVISSLLVCSRSIPTNRSNGFIASKLNAEMRSTSKKLSVVPEADEQLTVNSISQCLRQNNPPRSPVSDNNQINLQPQVKVVLFDRNSSNEKENELNKNVSQSENENKKLEEKQQFDRKSEPPNIHII